MSQLLLPLFPSGTHLITPSLGFYMRDDTVNYLLSGLPIYSHHKDDVKKFRYVTSSLIIQGLCKNSDIIRAFHVSSNSVVKWKQKLEAEGEKGFFGPEKRHGQSYKMLPALVERIQTRLDQGQSVNSIAKGEGISEGTIRYAVSTGTLKKR
jgi:transposase